MTYSRFAIYYLPPEGELASFGAKWLGWDVLNGRTVPRYDLPGLYDITMTPRKYGFHGTLKPPFRLKDGQTQIGLEQATSALARTITPAVCDGLELTQLGGFLALTPFGAPDGLRRVAEACVRGLDAFRAPADDAELARRRKSGLSARQEALMIKWGYPYVFEQFRFHLTLSASLSDETVRRWTNAVKDRLPGLPTPFVLDQIALCGERQDGRFEHIHRYTLAG